MRRLTPLLLICCLFAQTPVSGSEVSSGGSTERERSSAAILCDPQAIDRISREVSLVEYVNRDSRAAVMNVGVENAQQGQKRGWIARHPVLFSAIVGFGIGFPVGYATGNSAARGDPSSDYLTPEEKGLLVGGIGAGLAALIGKIVF